MTERIKVMAIFGTRPEAIKMAPLVLELKNRQDDFDVIVTVTAQHREMLDQVLEIFKIKPDFDLDIMQDKQSLTQITTRALEGLDKVMRETKPHIVLVHGDTSTTFVASLAAFYNKIAIGHVEAGLRTWDKYSPYPEEMNRQLTGVMADIHLSPTEKSKQNLLNENKAAERIYVTGNTAIDALKTTVDEKYTSALIEELGDKRLVLMTAHRRENIGNNMHQMFRAIKRLVEEHDDIQVVYPVHLNPVVVQAADEILGDDPRIKLIKPVSVIDFHNLIARSYIILSDSGGIQEEAPSLGVPVLVLRNTTERPEGIDAGTIKLVGTDEDTIFNEANELLSNEAAHDKMAKATNPYGDGHASARIADALLDYFKAEAGNK